MLQVAGLNTRSATFAGSNFPADPNDRKTLSVNPVSN